MRHFCYIAAVMGATLIIGNAAAQETDTKTKVPEFEYKVGHMYGDIYSACMIDDINFKHAGPTKYRTNGYTLTGVADCESGIVSVRIYTAGDKFIFADWTFISGYIFTIYTEDIPLSIKFPADIYIKYHIKKHGT